MTQTIGRRRRSSWTMRAVGPVVLLVVAAACSTADDESGAVVEVGEGPAASGDAGGDGSDTIAGDLLPDRDSVDFDAEIRDGDGPQYGDSIADWGGAAGADTSAPDIALPGFRSVVWDDLVPADFSSEQILDRYRDRLTEAEPGSAELDEIYNEMNAEYADASVNTQLDGEDIQLAGFVAPLTYDGDRITEFLLVPYFGACIHVPPPPVNQTVMITLGEGDSLSLEESWGAIWVAGELVTTVTDTEIATAGYSISGAQYGVYENQ